jgi:hypothetical protein
MKLKAAEPVYITSPEWAKDPKLQLYVVYTDVEGTRAALRTASHLACDLNARIVLMVAQVVPYPLPLEAPDVPGEFTLDALTRLAAEPGGDVSIRVFLCRDRDETVCNELPAASLVVIGGPKHWWSTRTPLLARLLRRAGHEVILARVSAAQPARLTSPKVESSL